jgi:uncharacterized protein YyaL (SSP411 family)
MKALFRDPESGGYWTSGERLSVLSFRMWEEYDGVKLRPIFLAAANLIRLSALLPEER